LGQHAQEQADDVLVAHQRVVHRRLVLQQRTAQQAFERAHQAPFGARQVLRNGIAPKVRAMVFGIEEQRCGQGVVLALQRNMRAGECPWRTATAELEVPKSMPRVVSVKNAIVKNMERNARNQARLQKMRTCANG
jgi:hypothetical protein